VSRGTPANPLGAWKRAGRRPGVVSEGQAARAKKDSLFEGVMPISYRKQRKSKKTNSKTNCLMSRR